MGSWQCPLLSTGSRQPRTHAELPLPSSRPLWPQVRNDYFFCRKDVEVVNVSISAPRVCRNRRNSGVGLRSTIIAASASFRHRFDIVSTNHFSPGTAGRRGCQCATHSPGCSPRRRSDRRKGTLKAERQQRRATGTSVLQVTFGAPRPRRKPRRHGE